jgi:hypothetical protein
MSEPPRRGDGEGADDPRPAERDDDEMDHRFAADEEVAEDPAGAEEARTPGQGS